MEISTPSISQSFNAIPHFSVKTAIIPVGGFGSRVLPLTAAVPKNLLPLAHRTIIHHAVVEAIAAGIETIVIVCSEGDIEKYRAQFVPNTDLKAALKNGNKADLLKRIEEIETIASHITFVSQSEVKGSGYGVLGGRNYVTGPFAVILPDDCILDDDLEPRALTSMIDTYQGGISIARLQVPIQETHRYGIFNFGGTEPEHDAPLKALSIIEKPSSSPPSHYAALGRYILPAEIMDILAKETQAENGEIQITDAIAAMVADGKAELFATPFKGQRYDCGTLEAYMEATLTASAKYFILRNLSPEALLKMNIPSLPKQHL